MHHRHRCYGSRPQCFRPHYDSEQNPRGLAFCYRYTGNRLIILYYIYFKIEIDTCDVIMSRLFLKDGLDISLKNKNYII